jgi:hypothetical protein
LRIPSAAEVEVAGLFLLEKGALVVIRDPYVEAIIGLNTIENYSMVLEEGSSSRGLPCSGALVHDC